MMYLGENAIPVSDEQRDQLRAWAGELTGDAALLGKWFLMGGGNPRRTPVSEIMKKEVTTVTPDTQTIEALRTMRRLGIGCLPVLHDDKLVGMITEESFMDLATKLLEEQMGITEQLPLPLDEKK